MNKGNISPAPAAFSLDNVADLYIRVSTTEQAEEGYSVGEQEARLRSYCSAMGFTVNAVHIDPGLLSTVPASIKLLRTCVLAV